MTEEELKLALAKFPSHFYIEEDKACRAYLTGPSIRNIRDRIEDDKKLYDARICEGEEADGTQVRLREHFMCRDANLKLYLDYCENAFVIPERKIQEMIQTHPSSKVSLCNLAHIKIVLGQVSAAESILVELKQMTPLERVLADAEIAYAYLKMGPRGHLDCKKLSERIVNSDHSDYPGLSQIAAPDRALLGELQVEYSYMAALAIERMFAENVHGDVLKKDESGGPEILMKESAKFLKKVESSRSKGYKAIALLMLRNTFQRYKKINPSNKRLLTFDCFGWPDLTTADQFLAVAEQAVAEVGIQNADYRAVDRLGDEYRKFGPKQDLDKAEKYLEAAAERSKRPAIYHHLALVYRQKWEKEHPQNIDKRNTDLNIRDPGNPLLKKAIEQLEAAISYSHKTFVLFQVDLARLKYSYCKEPTSKESSEEIMTILNGCVSYTMKLGLTTSGDQAYLFIELALMHKELFDDKKMYRKYLMLSVEQAIKANKYSSALHELIQLHKHEKESPSKHEHAERYKRLGDLFCKFEQYGCAKWNLERARKMMRTGNAGHTGRHGRGRRTEDPDILKNLTVVLLKLGEFHHAKQILVILKTNDEKYLENPENRKQYMDLSLEVARQFPSAPDTAATIYQELITELKPNTEATSVVVLSSEEKSDEERTKALVCMIRQGLGFNEDTCVLPNEKLGCFLGESSKPTPNYIEYFVKKAWCVVVHLTDRIFEAGAELLLRDVDNSIDCVQKRKGRVIVVNDVNEPDQDWEERTGKMRGCTPWMNFTEILHGPSNSPDTNDNVLSAEDTLLFESKIEQSRPQEAAGSSDTACRGAVGGSELVRSENVAGTTIDKERPRPKGLKELEVANTAGTDNETRGEKQRGMGQPSSAPISKVVEVPQSEEVEVSTTSVADIVQGPKACIDKKSAAPPMPVAGDFRWDVMGLELLVRAMLEP